jgi:5-methylcytosine-specific restriction endonuclease McrA
MCGARAEDGAALHVDHRVTVAKGGINDDENLWTLCDRCNLGKADLDL